jgi:hypothetical protein
LIVFEATNAFCFFFRNLIKHNIKSLESVKNQLKAVDTAGADIDDIIEILEDLGKQAASRR